ncbi:MAG: alpha/beta fold hydrolase [Candidatus Harrisonbacteria bacterium]|nr:alpha/beta fold hydrolase [Candidatus Harrisonbacteria bacterium]
MKLGKVAGVIISIVAAILALILLLNYGQRAREIDFMIEKINLTTSDDVKIVGSLYPVSNPKEWLFLVHMMPATKESWKDFATAMQKEKYESIAIDLRGHGESDGGPNGYQKFSDTEHQVSIQDLMAAWEFLKSRGATPDKLTVIGASIGANLSLQFLIKNPEVQRGVLLSAGDYRGLDSGHLVGKLRLNQKVLFVASKKDDRAAGNNAVQNQQYYDSAPTSDKQLILYESAGHGTDLLGFSEKPDLTEAIKEFLMK